MELYCCTPDGHVGGLSLVMNPVGHVCHVQVCYHMGSETEPDERDKQTDRQDVDAVSSYISRCLPGLVPEPAVVESCMYTVSQCSLHYTVYCSPYIVQHADC